MQPIISPWVFYWIHTLSELRFFFGSASVLFFVALCMTFFVWLHFKENEEGEEKLWKWCRRCGILLLLCAMGTAIIPNKETMYQMLMMQQITPDNIEVFKGEVKGIVDYVIQKSVEVRR